MKTGDMRFTVDGEVVRVVIVGDVIALPNQGWSMAGFGTSISVEWMLHDGKLPGRAAWRRKLAQCVVDALRFHHARAA